MQKTIVKSVGKCPKLPWMVEFHSEGKVLNNQLKAAFAENFLEHLSSLSNKSKANRKRLTQFSVIVPGKITNEKIEKFLKAGMTLAILKLEFFSIETLEQTVKQLREVNENFGKSIGRIYPLAIGLEITEPEILTGKLQKPQTDIHLKKGQLTKITCNPKFCHQVTQDHLYIGFDNLTQTLKPGDSLILGNDEIRLSAVEISKEIVNCLVEKAGRLTDNLTVKLPNIPLCISMKYPPETLKEIHEKCDIDIVFVNPGRIEMTKEIFGPTVLIFTKIEYNSSVDIFNDCIQKVDGALFDGDKTIMTSEEKIFLVQKSIIARCNKLSKPIISIINCHHLTKAQVNDIANTVIDGVDGLLLPPDNELLESVSMICKAAESAIYQKQVFENLSNLKSPPIEPIISIAMSAVETSFKTNAAAIILLTSTGRSAKLISGFRPRCPIIALTRFGRIARQLMVYKGVIPIFYIKKSGDSFRENVEKNMQLGMTFGKINGYIRAGDAVVIVFGVENDIGFKNCLEVVFASEYDTIPMED